MSDELHDEEPGESLPPEDVFANAPEREGDYFKVPPLPTTGKLAFFAPEVAARMFDEAGDEEAKRIFAAAGLPEDQAYIVDLDEVRERMKQLPMPTDLEGWE